VHLHEKFNELSKKLIALNESVTGQHKHFGTCVSSQLVHDTQYVTARSDGDYDQTLNIIVFDVREYKYPIEWHV
jgi:hypothetical protein